MKNYLLSLVYLWDKVRNMGNPVRIHLANNGLISSVRYPLHHMICPVWKDISYFQSFAYLWHKVRSMGHPVRIQLINNILIL